MNGVDRRQVRDEWRAGVGGERSMMVFVVRLTRDEGGRIVGVVEAVRTGMKERVEGLPAVGEALARLIAPVDSEPHHDHRTEE
jgi:hypothetical protein